MRKLIKILLLTVALLLTPAVNTYAQSAASKYDEGVTLYNKGNYQGAIKLFNEAMILNKSAANKKKCQAMIDKCKKAAKAKKSEAQPKKPVVSDKVELERENLYVNGFTASAEVISVTAPGGWRAEMEHDVDKSWLSFEVKDEGKFLIVKTTPSKLTITRTGTILIISELNSREVKRLEITQGKGRNASISVNKEEIKKINGKGDEVLVTVNCQSDTLLADGRNWYITKAPAWVKPLGTKKEKKTRVNVAKNELSMEIAPNPTKEERSGYVTLRSQDAECIVKLVQRKGK